MKRHPSRLACHLVVLWIVCLPAICISSQTTPLDWSRMMADSQIIRSADGLLWQEAGKAKWDYTSGLFTLSLLRFHQQLPRPIYIDYVKAVIDSFVEPNGTIRTYRLEDFNLDNINSGKTTLALWSLTGQQRYKQAADLLRSQLHKQPRTSEGGFWHKQRYPNQMWLDGIYMASPFYAQYALLFDQAEDLEDVARQIRLISTHTYDQAKGLFYHGWDESRQQQWANKTTGTSPNFWGRAMGWFAMACVDVLDFFAPDHPLRGEILATLRKVCDGIVRYQDPQSGLWYQVLDQAGREGNYLESSASCMFVYTLAKAVNLGYIDRSFAEAAKKGYQGIIDRFIKVDPNGMVHITQCCAVAGLGYGRDGSYKYYLSEPIVQDDLKAVGPFILAGIEVHKLLGLPMELVDSNEPDPRLVNAVRWACMHQILRKIEVTTFPDRRFLITEFGARPQTDASEGISRAIDACASSGGGMVIVPEGTYITGPIRLKSNVNLHLHKGATLLFKTDPNAYLPQVLTRFEGMECWNYSPFIYACGQSNIALTGDGTIDGQASDQNWWAWKTKGSAARRRLVQMVAANVPVEQRWFGNGDYLRPAFIQFYGCEKVLIDGIHIRRSPMWNINPVMCRHVIVRGVDVMSHGPNNDGCNPESCQYVLIEGCVFDTGDDCIAIKSGRNNDGRRIDLASSNIVIRGCTMKDGHGGVTIGSEISGGCHNVFVEDCRMDSPNLDRALRFKSNAVRGGTVEGIFMRNVTVGRVADAVLQIDFAYEEGAKGPYKPVVRDVFMQKVTVEHTPRVLNVVGIPNGQIEAVWLVDSVFRRIAKQDVVRQANVKLIDCSLDRKD